MAIDLSSIKKGKNLRPPRIFLYSTHGIGKSTFASQAPNPIFICAEDGLDALDVAHFPIATSSADVMEMIQTLYTEEHEYQTVALDTVDWLENLLNSEIEAEHDAKELAYGRAAMYLANKWRDILDGFNALRNDKGMNVILIGHSEIKRFDSPEVDSYDRYQPKLQTRSSAIIQEWADCVFFANYKTVVKKEDLGFNKERGRAISNGERMIFTQEKPAYLAKNRYSLPDSFSLNWGAFNDAMIKAVV
jgi:hypothetical protein